MDRTNKINNIRRIIILIIEVIFVILPLVMYNLDKITSESAILSLILVVLIVGKLDDVVKELN